MQSKKALKGASQGVEAVDVSQVFSTYVYTGNGATQDIVNGIDLATEGGMVWIKDRDTTYEHLIFDTERTLGYALETNTTDAETNYTTSLIGFNTDGFDLGSGAFVNSNGSPNVSWAFRNAPRFHQTIKYTGNGIAGREIPHNLGCDVGMIIVKGTSYVTDWRVKHKDISNTLALKLNATTATQGSTAWNSTDPTDTHFTVGTTTVNESGQEYIAYLFAHDTLDDGVIQCNSFTTDVSGNGSFDFGWADGVQYIKMKCSSTTGDWEIFDNVRTPSFSSTDARLRANLSNAEDTVSRISASGTTLNFSGLSASQTYVFMAVKAQAI